MVNPYNSYIGSKPYKLEALRCEAEGSRFSWPGFGVWAYEACFKDAVGVKRKWKCKSLSRPSPNAPPNGGSYGNCTKTVLFLEV